MLEPGKYPFTDLIKIVQFRDNVCSTISYFRFRRRVGGITLRLLLASSGSIHCAIVSIPVREIRTVENPHARRPALAADYTHMERAVGGSKDAGEAPEGRGGSRRLRPFRRGPLGDRQPATSRSVPRRTARRRSTHLGGLRAGGRRTLADCAPAVDLHVFLEPQPSWAGFVAGAVA